MTKAMRCFFYNTIFVSSHMYPENPEGTQVIVGSINMGYISDTARNRTHNLFRPKREPIPLGHSDGDPRSRDRCHVSEGQTEDYGAFRQGVRDNSILCVGTILFCVLCSGISGRLRNNVDFHCRIGLNGDSQWRTEGGREGESPRAALRGGRQKKKIQKKNRKKGKKKKGEKKRKRKYGRS